jgi:hypothetical protein
MLYIEPLSEKYFHDVQKYIQELQEYIVSCEVWEDDLIVYDTTTEAQESLYAYESSEVIIFIAREEEEVYGFILGRIRKDVSKGSKIQYYGSVGRLYVGKDYRGQ